MRLRTVLSSVETPTGIFGQPTTEVPVFFEHDVPLREDECGGPVIGLDGMTYGISISRAHAHGCVAIPVDAVLGLISEFQEGNHAYSAPIAAIKEHSVNSLIQANLTAVELAEKLRVRLERLRTFSIKYDITSEACIDPQKLLSWNYVVTRDEKESHEIAVDGKRRMTVVTKQSVAPYLIPPDLVNVDPRAPSDIALLVRRRKEEALTRKWEGDYSFLFARQGERIVTKYLYDGDNCWVWNDLEGKWSATLPSLFELPSIYLAGVGLCPLAAHDGCLDRSLSYDWQPENFAADHSCTIRPDLEIIDGKHCVVVECERTEGEDRHYIQEVSWLDPELGYSPRRRELLANDVVVESWANSSFKDFGRDCWLPQVCRKTLYAPHWADAEYRGQPAIDRTICIKSFGFSRSSDK